MLLIVKHSKKLWIWRYSKFNILLYIINFKRNYDTSVYFNTPAVCI